VDEYERNGKRVSQMDDAELMSAILDAGLEIKVIADELSTYHQIMTQLTDEQDRRALAAYWKANPDLLPLAVGDKVTITEEYQAYYRRTNPNQGIGTEVGEVYGIEEIHIKNGEIDYFSMEEFGGRTPLYVVIGMRRAYLAAHANDESEVS